MYMYIHVHIEVYLDKLRSLVHFHRSKHGRCISMWSRPFCRKAPCICGCLWGTDSSMYMLALHPVGSSVISAGTRVYNDQLLHYYFIYAFKIMYTVLRAVFRCWWCQMTTQTWDSSRFFGGHYLVNQKYRIFVLCILCMILDQEKPYSYKLL